MRGHLRTETRKDKPEEDEEEEEESHEEDEEEEGEMLATGDEMTETGSRTDMMRNTMRGRGPGKSGGKMTTITQTDGRMTGDQMTTNTGKERTEDRRTLTGKGEMGMTNGRTTTAGATSKDMTRQTDSITTTGFGLNRPKDNSE